MARKRHQRLAALDDSLSPGYMYALDRAGDACPACAETIRTRGHQCLGCLGYVPETYQEMRARQMEEEKQRRTGDYVSS